MPKRHVADIFEYDPELAGEVFSRVPKIAQALEKAFPEMKGLNILNNNRELAYQSVFHSHIHLVLATAKRMIFLFTLSIIKIVMDRKN